MHLLATSIVYFMFFTGVNLYCDSKSDSFETKRVTFHNEVGQWVYGYLAIAVSIVLIFYILWYRSFKSAGYAITWRNMLLYILLQGVSIVIGLFFYNKVENEVDLILTSFVLLPLVAVSFSAFFGIWVANDFNGYEDAYVKSQNFNPAEVEEYNKMGCYDKLCKGAW